MKRAVLFTALILVAGMICALLRAEDKQVPAPPRMPLPPIPLPNDVYEAAQLGPSTYEGKPLDYWVERLQKCEADADRHHAAEAIKAFGSDAADAGPTLVHLLDDRAESFRELVAEILCVIGPGAKGAVPTLVASLKSRTARSPALVIKVLGSVGPDAKEAVPELRKALQNDNSRIRYRAARALWVIEKDTHGVPVLAALLKDDSPEIAQAAAESLGEIGPAAKAALPELRKAAAPHISGSVGWLTAEAKAAQRAIEKIDPAEAKKAKPAPAAGDPLFAPPPPGIVPVRDR